MLVFSEGVIQERQLEPDDEATYIFTVKNTCTCVRLVEITLTFETRTVAPTRDSFLASPQTKSIAKLEPGEEIQESVTVKTKNALVGRHSVWINATATPQLVGEIPEGIIAVEVSED